MNTIHIIGNLGADPEIKESNGLKWAKFRVATTERWKSKDGQKQERTDWHTCVVNGGMANVVEKYLRKGAKVAVTGSQQHREHDGKYYAQIKVQNLEMLGGPQQSEPARQQQPTGAKNNIQNEDDLPF